MPYSSNKTSPLFSTKIQLQQKNRNSNDHNNDKLKKNTTEKNLLIKAQWASMNGTKVCENEGDFDTV